ncbi:PilN domain-containing protein [Pseudomonas sp. LS1212]|uniref:PilN domain-containing protein n=1 Tax=Pseudomonas sp. LS1212 TaxID=2972478 RepID=UPI00215B9F47|nr:PilN domain-containing protein [Pseudomonas sp. LS1212]UVJ44397.1 PilN domain-containing protein [Pseudomonas sp. LS1212]
MARINLLPWREELREQRRKRFLMMMAGVVVASVAVVLLAGHGIDRAIERQTVRNAYVQSEIDQLDTRIKQIDELKSRRRQLLDRMQIIEDLQGNRPLIGHIFDQLVRTLPDGVHFTDVKREGKTLSLSGAAESNHRVSELMRNLETSPWLEAPNLTEVKAIGAGEAGQASFFRLAVRQSQPQVGDQAR